MPTTASDCVTIDRKGNYQIRGKTFLGITGISYGPDTSIGVINTSDYLDNTTSTTSIRNYIGSLGETVNQVIDALRKHGLNAGATVDATQAKFCTREGHYQIVNMLPAIPALIDNTSHTDELFDSNNGSAGIIDDLSTIRNKVILCNDVISYHRLTTGGTYSGDRVTEEDAKLRFFEPYFGPTQWWLLGERKPAIAQLTIDFSYTTVTTIGSSTWSNEMYLILTLLNGLVGYLEKHGLIAEN